MIRWVAALSAALLSLPAFAELNNTCGEATAVLKYTYCISKTKGSRSRDILFVLHSGQGDEYEWIRGFEGVREIWEERGIEAPIVINVSFGPIWILLKKNSTDPSGLMDILKYSIYPKLERLALGQKQKPGKRLLLGASMGGFNTAQLLFNSHHGTYAKAVIMCPAIIGLSPWASEQEITQFVEKERANEDTVRGIIEIVKTHVPDKATWEREADPIALASRVLNKNTPTQIMITTNQEDHTFIAGGRLFAKATLASGAPVRYEDWSGGHCDVDVETVADFLAR